MKKTISLLSFLILISYKATVAQDFSKLFKTLDPAVVTIQTTEFKNSGAQTLTTRGIGSGFIVNPEGFIITAAHVVQNASSIRVKLWDGKVVSADVVKTVPSVDIALIKLQSVSANLPLARLGNSDLAEIGEQVLVIGAPLGLEHTLSTGHLSGKINRNIMADGEVISFIQTDAAINQGNSGGPIFNSDGEVIGIVSFILSKSGGSDGIGFGVDINSAKKILLENNAIWTGFDGIFLTETIAGILNVPQKSGVLVQRVTTNSFADKIGLKGGFFQTDVLGENLWLGGDIILSIQGVSCDTPHSLESIKQQIQGLNPNDSVLISVLRKGEIVELSNIVIGF